MLRNICVALLTYYSGWFGYNIKMLLGSCQWQICFTQPINQSVMCLLQKPIIVKCTFWETVMTMNPHWKKIFIFIFFDVHELAFLRMFHLLLTWSHVSLEGLHLSYTVLISYFLVLVFLKLPFYFQLYGAKRHFWTRSQNICMKNLWNFYEVTR